MAMSTAASAAASAAAAPLSLLLRPSSAAASCLTSVRAGQSSLLRSSAAARPPRLSAAFSSPARSLQSTRVISVSVSAASAPPSALSASAAPPLADLSQSAAHRRSLSTTQAGSSLVTPLCDQSSASSSLSRPSSASSTGLSSTHFSAASFVVVARKQPASRPSSPEACAYLRAVSQSRMQSALKRLKLMERLQSDPLVSALSDCLQQLDIIRHRAPACEGITDQELDQLLLRLADVALWMPLTREACVDWLSDPSDLPFTRSTEDPNPARLESAMKRLRTARPNELHPLVDGLLQCMQQLDSARRSLRIKDSSSGESEFVSVQRAQLALADFVHSLPVRRDGRWLAATHPTALLFDALAWRPLLLVAMVLSWLLLQA